MRSHSWLFWWKTQRTLRVPAGDSPDDCECGDFLLTELGEPIQTELTSYLSPEE